MDMWKLLDGKKTYLGVIVWVVVQLLMSAKPEWMDLLKTVETLAVGLTGVGVGHKLEKIA